MEGLKALQAISLEVVKAFQAVGLEGLKALQAIGGRFKGSPGHRLEVVKAFQAVGLNFRELVKKSWACTGMASQRGFAAALRRQISRKPQWLSTSRGRSGGYLRWV